MTETAIVSTEARMWATAPVWVGALSGVVVVLGFVLFHDIFIVDIWFNLGPMLIAGAVCGLSVAWSYRWAEVDHSTGAWFRYGGLYAAEIVALGAVSIAVLQPRFTMAEMLVADDAMGMLLPPSMPFMVGAMLIGTFLFWLYYGRRIAAVIPILITQVLVVFLLGHQLAFLGLIESSSTLLVAYVEFALIAVVIAAVYCSGVMWATIALNRLRPGS